MLLMLKSVYETAKRDENLSLLYRLLVERKAHESISHIDMPTWGEHSKFVDTKPYKGWYIIVSDSEPVGSIYITYQNEIGIHILDDYRKKGIGTAALAELMAKHQERFYLANINPANEKSVKFFTEKHAFKHIQNTYKLERKYDAGTGL